jgi:drug/metabolite transporter (DMT)-like permease
MLGLGFLGYTGLYILQMTALKHIASSQSAAIMLLAPVFTLVAESFLKKELRSREAIVTAIGFAGAAAILVEQYRVDFSGVAFQGLLLTVGASLCLGISVIQTKRLLAPVEGKPAFTVFNLTFFSLLIGAVGLIPFVAVEQVGAGGRLPMTADFWLWSAYLGILCSVGAFLMWNWSIKQVSPVGVAIAMYLKTPVALGIGAVLLSEHLTLIFYAGTLLILGTLFSNQLVLVRGKR